MRHQHVPFRGWEIKREDGYWHNHRFEDGKDYHLWYQIHDDYVRRAGLYDKHRDDPKDGVYGEEWNANRDV